MKAPVEHRKDGWDARVRISLALQRIRIAVAERTDALARAAIDRSRQAGGAVAHRLAAIQTTIVVATIAVAVTVRAKVQRGVEATIDRLVRARRFVVALPGIILRRLERMAITVLKLMAFVLYIVPRWLVTELPGHIQRSARALVIASARFARTLVNGTATFFQNEVVPTSQFFVEVPVGLGGPAMHDLGLRLPVWLLSDVPLAGYRFVRPPAVALWHIFVGTVRHLLSAMWRLLLKLSALVRRVAIRLRRFALWLIQAPFNAPRFLARSWYAVRRLARSLGRWMLLQATALQRTLAGLVHWIARFAHWLFIDLPRWLWIELFEMARDVYLVLSFVARGVWHLIRSVARFLTALPLRLYRAAVTLAQALFVRLPRWLWQTAKSIVVACADLAVRCWLTLVSLGRWLVLQLTLLPGRIYRVLLMLSLNIWRALTRLVALIRAGAIALLRALDRLPAFLRAVANYIERVLIGILDSLLDIWGALADAIRRFPQTLRAFIAHVGETIARLLWSLSPVLQWLERRARQALSLASDAMAWTLAVVFIPFYILWRLSRAAISRF
jgi:hypothetical protein